MAEQKIKEYNEVEIEILEANGLKITNQNSGCFCIGGGAPYTSSWAKVKDVKGLRGDSRKSKIVARDSDPVYNFKTNYQFNFKLSSFKFKVECAETSRDIGEATIDIGQFLLQAQVGQKFTIDAVLPLKKGDGTLHVKVSPTFWIPVILPGHVFPLPPKFQIGLAWDFKKRQAVIDLDASVVALDVNNQVIGKIAYDILKDLSSQGTLARVVTHSGDDRTGEGDGDDETVTFDMPNMPSSVARLLVCINSYNGQPISSCKFAYFRLICNNQTIGFYGLGRGKDGSSMIPNCNGLFMGAIERSGDGWSFVTVAQAASGNTVSKSVPAMVQTGVANNWWMTGAAGQAPVFQPDNNTVQA
jgi:tellurium resistance protein TerZ